MTQAFFLRTAKTLIRLDGCSDWSESSVGAHAIVLVLSLGGSNVFMNILVIKLKVERFGLL